MFGLLFFFVSLVYFTMHTFSGQWDCVWLLVYLVYRLISPCTPSLDSGSVSDLLVYLSIRSLTVQWDSVRFICFIGLFVNAISHWRVG